MKKSILMSTIVLFLFTASVAAEPITIKLNSPAPPRSTLNSKVFEVWAKKVTSESLGTLNVKTFYGGTLGNFRVNYDRVLDGVADVGFILNVFAPGKFKKTDVASLPFESESSTEAAVALWNLYEKGIISSEFNNVKLIAIWTFPNAAIHSKIPIRNLEELKGKKLSTSTKTLANIISSLGATPISLRPTEVYQAINRGVIVGSLQPFTAVKPFKLQEVTKYHLDVALGSSPAILFMNKQSYEKLPPKAKQAIDNNSGLEMSRFTGKHLDWQWLDGRNLVKAGVSKLSKEQEKNWKKILEPIAADWVKRTPDGAKVLQAYRAEIAKFRASNK